MPRVSALLVLRVAALMAMAASAALAVEYRSLDPSFCGVESGCQALRETSLAYLWDSGLTLPDVGLIGMSAVFALTLTRLSPWAARLAVPGGLVGLGLFGLQAFAIGRFCWLCVTTDVSALIAGGAGIALLLERRKAASASAALEPPSKPRSRKGGSSGPPKAAAAITKSAARSDARVDSQSAPARSGLAAWAWAAFGALAVAGPALWPSVKPAPPVPEPIRAHYVKGKINVVEFADFECPFCRNLHQRLKALLGPYGDRVHFVRLNMPLERHPNAHDAALAAICAEGAGKADEFAEFLFSTEDLSREAIEREASTLGLPAADFTRCLAAPATAKRLERESRILRDVGFEGLPTTYIGGTRIVGAQSDEAFGDALEKAASGNEESGLPAWLYLLIVGAIGAGIVRFGLE